MVTRAKNGIFKLKVFLANYSKIEPPTVKEALTSSHWVAAMKKQ